jgi:hypothetical protein
MARPKYPSDNVDRFLVRMPDGLREQIKERARKNMRSANGEIVWMLQRLLEAENKTASDSGATPSEA